MSNIAISVEKLGKRYRIGGPRVRYRTLRESIMGSMTSWITHLREPKSKIKKQETIWALKNISLEMKRGEVLGIIGRNGAGKSTFLKILSHITEPTEGRAIIHGRVGSLLEIGTGFHPELTGRENIYLNGAILGMKKNEIDGKFDAIVEFAEIEKFLNTPVKHYSSGMFVRLAFAVAAHLDLEILLVDEVLAVGDGPFQKKCLNKIQDVGREGRTVLFVSHNMPAIRTLCTRAILIDRGILQYEGEPAQVVQHYLRGDEYLTSQKVWRENERPGNQTFRLNSVKLKNTSGEEVSAINISEEAQIEIEYELVRGGGRAQFSLVLFDADGYCVFGSLSNTEPNFYGKPMPEGNYCSLCRIYGHLLNSGRYHVSITGGSAHWGDSFTADHVISFDAVDDGVLKGDYFGGYGGVIRPKLQWTTISLKGVSSSPTCKEGKPNW